LLKIDDRLILIFSPSRQKTTDKNNVLSMVQLLNEPGETVRVSPGSLLKHEVDAEA
jgi:hypothetical protein